MDLHTIYFEGFGFDFVGKREYYIPLIRHWPYLEFVGLDFSVRYTHGGYCYAYHKYALGLYQQEYIRSRERRLVENLNTRQFGFVDCYLDHDINRYRSRAFGHNTKDEFYQYLGQFGNTDDPFEGYFEDEKAVLIEEEFRKVGETDLRELQTVGGHRYGQLIPGIWCSMQDGNTEDQNNDN